MRPGTGRQREPGAEAMETEMKKKYGTDSVYDPGVRSPPTGPPPTLGRGVRFLAFPLTRSLSRLHRRRCRVRVSNEQLALGQGKMQYTTQNVPTSDLRRFLMDPGPKDGSILCHIRREKGKLGYPYYAVYLEAPGVGPGSAEGERFLLSARKRKKSKTSNYLISLDLEDTSRQASAPCLRFQSPHSLACCVLACSAHRACFSLVPLAWRVEAAL